MFTPSPYSKVYAAQDGEQFEGKSDSEGDKGFHQTNGEDEVHPQLLQQSLDEAPAHSRELDQAQLKFLLKQVAINRRYDRWNYYLSYDFYKESMKWFLDTATIDFSFTVSTVDNNPYFIVDFMLSRLADAFTFLHRCDTFNPVFTFHTQFEDITLLMTLFVLFADDIKILCSPARFGNELAFYYNHHILSSIC